MRTRRKWTWRAAAGVTELTDGSQMLPASRVREEGRLGGGLCPEKQTALVRYAARNENSVRVVREPHNGQARHGRARRPASAQATAARRSFSEGGSGVGIVGPPRAKA
jgi:hypothetical protein